jgi:methionyl-tRNA synthetase
MDDSKNTTKVPIIKLNSLQILDQLGVVFRMFKSRKAMYVLLPFLTLTFLMVSLYLPVCLAEDIEEPVEEEKTVFEQLQEDLEDYRQLMSEGEVEEALEVLREYLATLEELTQDTSELSEVEAHAAHILYVTSKHLAVLIRVYEKAPETAQKGISNALAKSTKGHSNAFKHIENAEIGDVEDGDPEGEEAESDDAKGKNKEKKEKEKKNNKGGKNQ